MYEVKCPSCGHVETSAFVRIGAAIECTSCHEVFTIAAKDVKRNVQIPRGGANPLVINFGAAGAAGGGGGATATAAPPDEEEEDSETAKTAINPAVTEDSLNPSAEEKGGAGAAAKVGAADDAAAEPVITDADLVGNSDPVGDVKIRSHGGSNARRQAQARKLRRKRHQGPVLFAAILFVGLLGVVAFGVWLLSNRDVDEPTSVAPTNRPSTNTGNDNFTPPTGPPQLPGVTDGGGAGGQGNGGMPPIPGMPGGGQQEPEEEIEPVVVEDPRAALLAQVPEGLRDLAEADLPTLLSRPVMNVRWDTDMNRQFLEGPKPEGVSLAKQQLSGRTADPPYFAAELTYTGPQPLRGSDLVLILVDERDRQFAQANVPMPLVAPNQPLSLVVPMSDDVRQRISRVDWGFRQGDSVPSIAWLSDLRWLALPANGGGVELRVDSRNPTSQPLGRADMLIRGRDANGRVVAQWLVEWKSLLMPEDRARFVTELDVDTELPVVQWDVLGVGRTR